MTRFHAGMSEQRIHEETLVGSTILDRDTTLMQVNEVRTRIIARAPKTRRIPAFALSITVAFLLIAILFAGLSMRAPQVSAYSPHDPIRISSNLDFTLTNGVIGGSGTVGDPYVISGWEILSDTGEGIYIHDTSAYFVIRDVYVHGTGSNQGIHFGYTTSGSIINCTLTANLVGIRLDDTSNIAIADNILDDQYDSGIMLGYSYNIQITNNSIDRNAYGVYAGFGVHDISIVNNSMDDSDYGGLMVSGPALRLSVVGNTMRTNSWGYGIAFSTTATNNYVADNNLSDNSGGGMSFSDASYTNIIRNNKVLDNYNGYGIYISRGDGNVMENNTVSGNSDDGIYMGPQDSAGQNYIANNTIGSNLWGIECDLGTGYRILNNTIIGNRAGGISFRGNDAMISGNSILDNQDFGFVLRMSSPRNTITGNTFVNDGLFGSFISSENNVISSNTVNGRPLVFLDKVKGYSVPSAGQVVAKDCSNLTVNGLNLSAASVGIELWNSVDCTVQGVALTGSTYGVYMENGSQRNHVLLCNISGNYIGTYLSSQSNQNFIERNTVNQNSYAGATLSSSNDNSFMGNDFVSNGGGFQISQCARTIIQGNLVKDTGFGAMITSSSNITVSRNDFNNTGAYGLYLDSTSRCTIESNHINAIGAGVYMIYDSNSNLIWNNTIYQSNEGVYVTSFDPAHTCNWNNITGNNITDNTLNGIWLSYAKHNTVSWNNVTGCGFGIRLNATSTLSNWLFLNNFTGNTFNAYSDCPANSNWWNTTVPVWYVYEGSTFYGYLGNRYGDYLGPDANADGVGEWPYTVGTEQDNYPLLGLPTVMVPEFPGLALPIIALILVFAAIGSASARKKQP